VEQNFVMVSLLIRNIFSKAFNDDKAKQRITLETRLGRCLERSTEIVSIKTQKFVACTMTMFRIWTNGK